MLSSSIIVDSGSLKQPCIIQKPPLFMRVHMLESGRTVFRLASVSSYIDSIWVGLLYFAMAVGK